MVCKPRLRVAQPYSLHYANEVQQVANLAGIDQTQWQVDLVADWSAHRADGQFIHRRGGASIPRQAGKRVDGIAWCTFLLSVLGYSILWTDHNYSTTCEMLRRFQKIFGKRVNDRDAQYRYFNDLVESVSNRTAQEAIFLKNGGFICFSTRTKASALGFSFDVVVYDEAQELRTEHMQAIQPTTSSGAHHNTQSLFLGTPTREGSYADIFSDMHAEAWDKPLDDMCWIEYGVGEVGDVLDESRWREANPSIDEGVADIDAIRTGIRTFKSDTVAAAQEYLGYWLPKVANAVISKDDWDECLTEDPPESRKGEKMAVGIKFTADGSKVALAAAVKQDRRVYTECLDYADMNRGVSWLADWLIERKNNVAMVFIDGKSNTGSLVAKLNEAGYPRKGFKVMGTSDVIQASSMFANAVKERGLEHSGQPLLDESVCGATRRPIGNDGGWGFGNGRVDCAPAEAVAFAYMAVMTTKRNPNRELRVG